MLGDEDEFGAADSEITWVKLCGSYLNKSRYKDRNENV